MKKLILGAAMSCSLLFSSQAQVTLTVNPTQTVATAPRSLYGVNFQRALNDGEAANASFKARINDMNPEMIRYHAFEQKVDGHANSWIDFAAQAWRATKIDAVLDNAPVSGDKILITISGWPNWMDTNNDGKLDTDKYTAYANFCASLVNIVNNQHGHAVRYWEPFNEMDGGTYSGSSDMVQLASIFRSCYTAMKAQDANIKIVGGAWRQPWDADIDDFLDNLGTAYLDVWSHHEYGGGSQTNVQELYNRTHLEWGISHMRTKLNNKGYTNVPVWLDEWNIYWTYDADGYPNMSNHVSAVYDALVYKYIAEQGIAGAVFSWNAADGRYGKVEPDYSGLRPGGRLLKLFGSLAHGQVLSTTSGNDTQIQGFAVRNTANNTLMIAVINRHSGSVNVNLSASGWTPSSDVVTRYVISSAGYSSSTVSWASAVVGTSISTPASSVTIFVSQATGTGGGSTAP
ncbi:MAG: hypothetical protein HC842_00815 [Cytophagales bacterium]|nr:hypothetical protein [Cytophagales bacterium]